MINALMELPKCSVKGHGQMELRRPKGKQTYEQQFCGVWYDCQYPGCHSSVLFPSKELLDQLESMKGK